MQLMKKKCELCGNKIDKGKEIKEYVKVPEFNGYKEKPFCSKDHLICYQKYKQGTARKNFCPSCRF